MAMTEMDGQFQLTETMSMSIHQIISLYKITHVSLCLIGTEIRPRLLDTNGFCKLSGTRDRVSSLPLYCRVLSAQ